MADNCGCDFFFTLCISHRKYCIKNHKNIIQSNILSWKQNSLFIFSKLLAMGCANNNKIKWEITMAVASILRISHHKYNTINHKNILKPKVPTNKTKLSLQNFGILTTGCVNSSWQLTVAVSGSIHFSFFQNIAFSTTNTAL